MTWASHLEQGHLVKNVSVHRVLIVPCLCPSVLACRAGETADISEMISVNKLSHQRQLLAQATDRIRGFRDSTPSHPV